MPSMTAVGPRDALEAQPILEGAPPASHQQRGGSAADAGAWLPAAPHSRLRQWADDPFVRSVLINLALTLTWCVHVRRGEPPG